MAYYEIAVDLGSKFVYAGIAGTDMILKEPSVVARAVKSRKVLAIGCEAEKVYRNDKENVELLNPIKNGVVVDKLGAVALVKGVVASFVSKNSYEPQFKAKVAVTAGTTENEMRDIESVFTDAGITPVVFCESAVAAAKYCFGAFGVTSGGIINIGHNKTEVAILENGKVIDGATIALGGEHINIGIMYIVESMFKIAIDETMAEKIKEKCVSFNSKDVTTAIASGIGIGSGVRSEVRVTAKDFYPAVSDTVEYIAAAANSLFKDKDDNKLRALRRGGMFVTGGGSAIYGIDVFLSGLLNVPVRIPKNADYSVVYGLINK